MPNAVAIVADPATASATAEGAREVVVRAGAHDDARTPVVIGPRAGATTRGCPSVIAPPAGATAADQPARSCARADIRALTCMPRGRRGGRREIGRASCRERV